MSIVTLYRRKPDRRKIAAVLSLAALAMTGCRAIQIKLGMKVPLNTLHISAMEASLSGDPAIAPGGKSHLIVAFTGTDGKTGAAKTWTTEGAGHGKILWSDLVVTGTVVAVTNKGVVTLEHDPRKSDGKTGHVTVTAPSQPGVHAELDIPLRYNVSYRANYAGAPGANGMNGSDGQDGMNGSDGSLDPNNPSAGGNGGNGSDGSDGLNGWPGSDAPNVQVWLTMRPGSQVLVEAGVLAAGHKERYYLIDPQGGTLTVDADGGAGGSGGKGGRGGRGGQGGMGQPPGTPGMDGHDGRDGQDGSDGQGGQITVTYDPGAKAYLNLLHLSYQDGPKPVFNQAAVPPLW